MKREQVKVIDTMNAVDRARALREMHQALLLGHLVDTIASRVRNAWNSAGQAMTLVYGRSGR